MSAEQPKSAVPLPNVLAMVICDHVWRDLGSGKHTIIGTHDTVRTKSVPALHPILTVYLALTNGRGSCPLRIVVVDVDEDRDPVGCCPIEGDTSITFTNPRHVIEHQFLFSGLVFPEFGEYRIQAWSGQDCLSERSYFVVKP